MSGARATSGKGRPAEIRERRDSDMHELVAIAREVRRRDGYPVHLPGGDFERFLRRPATIAGFVAISDGRLVGHIAVNESTSDAAMRLLAAAAPGQRLGVVARLLVDPGHRRAGTGRALLRHAASWALAHGRLPVLDVVTTSLPAVELYRAERWVELGSIELDLPGLAGVRELVFTHPSVPSPR